MESEIFAEKHNENNNTANNVIIEMETWWRQNTKKRFRNRIELHKENKLF